MALSSRHTLHGYECFREVYLGLTEKFSKEFYKKSPQNLLNPAFTSQVKEGGEFFDHEDLTKKGYFYIPTHLIQGEITLEEDVNLINSFSITMIANFWQAEELVIRKSRGEEKEEIRRFEKKRVPFYPMMDSLMLGNLKARVRCGYVNFPEKDKLMEGVCIGVSPSFRRDGIPVVTLTFRDVGWQMGLYQVHCSYPNSGKNQDLSNSVGIKNYTNPVQGNRSREEIERDFGSTPNGTYFSFDEFVCKDKDRTEPPGVYWGNLRKLIVNLDKIRDFVGVPLNVNSGFRTQEHNKQVGGVQKSVHLVSGAADLSSPSISPSELYKAIEELISKKEIHDGGLALYNTFVHYDIASSRRWNET